MNEMVDLNSDLGEGAGFDDEILPFITSANIACGFHAGTPESISVSIRRAQKRGVAIGAHPSFNDRANFGRTEMKMAPEEIVALVAGQLGAFHALAQAAGATVNHVKPHGALYNMAARDRALADAIVQAVVAFDSQLIVFCPPSSQLEAAALAANLATMSEAFADRNYLPNGELVPRDRPDALMRDPIAAADRIVRMLRERVVRAIDGTDFPISANTICVHGDTPDAVAFVRALRGRLEQEQIEIAAPARAA